MADDYGDEDQGGYEQEDQQYGDGGGDQEYDDGGYGGDEQPQDDGGYGGDEQPQEYAEPEPEPEPEYKEPEPEPQYGGGGGGYGAAEAEDVNAGYSATDISKYCDDLYSENPSFDYFYCTLVNPKKGTADLQVEKSAKGGLPALVSEMKNKADQIIFFLLRVNTYDDEGSQRAKFIYGRYVGSKVPFMQKARLTTNLGAIADQFPVKHLSKDADEEMKEFTAEKLGKEFLRIGGAHKPARYDFGGGDVYKP